MSIKVYDIAAPRYERRGECQRCGACCLDERCEHFAREDDSHTGLQRGVCLVHDRKPEKCRAFPANPPLVFKTCTYWFWDRWEARPVRAEEAV